MSFYLKIQSVIDSTSLLILTAIYSGREMRLKLESALSQTSGQLTPETSVMKMQ